MTSTDRPTPPPELDDDLRAFLEALAAEDAETIRTVATYVDELAAWTESDRLTASDDSFTRPPFPGEIPDDASVSTEEIAGTTYYYFQWREGDEIRSKTVARDR